MDKSIVLIVHQVFMCNQIHANYAMKIVQLVIHKTVRTVLHITISLKMQLANPVSRIVSNAHQNSLARNVLQIIISLLISILAYHVHKIVLFVVSLDVSLATRAMSF